MLNNFVGTIGKNFADKITKAIITPAFIFWCGCLLIIVERLEITTIKEWFISFTDIQRIAIVLSFFMLISISNYFIKSIDFYILNILQGYYWPEFIKSPFIGLMRRERTKTQNTINELRNKYNNGQLSETKMRHYFALKSKILTHFPSPEKSLMPTKFGNILKSAEKITYYKYGLDMITCWPHLWFLLPSDVKKDLAEVYEKLRLKCHMLIFSILFLFLFICIYSSISWKYLLLAIPGIIITYLIYWVMLDSALTYASLMRASFDVYRLEIYKRLRWPLPRDPKEERKLGEQITAYISRGSDSTFPVFTN